MNVHIGFRKNVLQAPYQRANESVNGEAKPFKTGSGAILRVVPRNLGHHKPP